MAESLSLTFAIVLALLGMGGMAGTGASGALVAAAFVVALTLARRPGLLRLTGAGMLGSTHV